MGGDHKCPVCQATFTRPQHVARHMRSHTGDRPYKCVYCGDQFARSDLLSRHVNKCHANEKPITQSGTRRKGSAAATRATTSKQACDQCVQSSLPCDGCNPCAKCIQRKCRCTFVKFHRQTAPAGPGHVAPQNVAPPMGQPLPPAASVMSGRLGSYPRVMHSQDPMGLGAIPLSATSSTSTNMNDPIYADQFNFGLYPSSAPTGVLPPESAADYANRYRANAADLLRRDAIPGISQPQQNGLTSSSWPGWNPSHESHQDSRYPPHVHDAAGIIPGVSGQGPYQHGGFYSNNRRQSIDLDFSGSDSASHSDHSVPSSATSSSIHLPLGPMEGLSMPMSQSYQGSLGDGSSFSGQQDHDGRTSPHHQRTSSQTSNFEGRDGGFSSAFGLMSLDDPNVMAGLATDGAPFFSHAGMDTNLDPDATPMQVPPPGSQSATRPPLQNRPSTSTGYHWPSTFSLNTPGRDRETDTKELKDFWKQYMRTPLSGPGPANAPPGVKAETPGGMYRRPRVNSLPSVKTPLGPPGSSQYGYHQNHPFAIPTIQPKRPSGDSANNGISARTVHGTAEDLRSYEAAVLARKAPTTLSLNPRRRGTLSGAPPSGKQDSASPPPNPSATTAPQRNDGSSSLANAFGGGSLPPPHPSFIDNNPPRVTFAHEPEYNAQQMDSPVHDDSRESSVDVSDGSSGDSHDGQRPSFKRLPSQTLEPVTHKRAQLMRDNGTNGLGNGAGVPSVPTHSKGSMSLAQRRRMSVPSGSGPLELGPLPQ